MSVVIRQNTWQIWDKTKWCQVNWFPVCCEKGSGREEWFVGPQSMSALGQRPQGAGARADGLLGVSPPKWAERPVGSRRARGQRGVGIRRQLLSRGAQVCGRRRLAREECPLVAVRTQGLPDGIRDRASPGGRSVE